MGRGGCHLHDRGEEFRAEGVAFEKIRFGLPPTLSDLPPLRCALQPARDSLPQTLSDLQS